MFLMLSNVHVPFFYIPPCIKYILKIYSKLLLQTICSICDILVMLQHAFSVTTKIKLFNCFVDLVVNLIETFIYLNLLFINLNRGCYLKES